MTDSTGIIAALVVALIGALGLLPLFRQTIQDQVRCRITLDFEPYRSAAVSVPMGGKEEFIRRIQFYSRSMGMMCGDYWTEAGEVGNENGFLVIQSCNRYFNYHIENIYEPTRFHMQAMRHRSLRMADADLYFELMIRSLDPPFEVTDIRGPDDRVVPA